MSSIFIRSQDQIQRAVSLFQKGQSDTAIKLLESLLTSNPRNFDALHILGIIRAHHGQFTEAIDIFRKALAIKKNDASLQFNLAKALSECNQDEVALIHHKRASQLARENPDVWINYGRSLYKLNRKQEALEKFQQAVQIEPNHAGAWTNIGLLLHHLDRTAEALAALDRAIAIEPNLSEAHNNRGLVLESLGRHNEALTSYEKAIELAPNYIEAWQNKGINLGKNGIHKEAEICFHHVIKLDPLRKDAWNLLGTTRLELLDKSGAIDCFSRAISLDPNYGIAQANLATLLLEKGDFKTGWEHFEHRWESEVAPPALRTTRPRWSGNPDHQGALLLWGEQGIGDQILFSTILPELSSIPRKKYVALDKRLLPLYQRSLPGFEFIDLSTVSDDLEFSEQLPLGSLPRLYRRDLASFCNSKFPLLTPDKSRSTALRAKLSHNNSLLCGISWSSTRKFIGAHKSLELKQMASSLAAPEITFVNLQYGDTNLERQQLLQTHGIEIKNIDGIDLFNDLDGLAALIDACDIVISTSNSTAHLACAIGKETFLLLPLGKSRIWYWSEFDGKNPWYPTAHIYSQDEPGQWDAPLNRIRETLKGKL